MFCQFASENDTVDMEYTVFILMNSRGKYEVKGLLVLANMSTKSKAAVSCRNDAQRCTYRHIRL